MECVMKGRMNGGMMLQRHKAFWNFPIVAFD
jgi:hypothetical protein